jgi:hypothetical protein
MKNIKHKIVYILPALILVSLVFWLWPGRGKDGQPASKFEKLSRLDPASEEEVEAAIGDYCDGKRKEAGKLYSVQEMIEALQNNSEETEFVGGYSASPDTLSAQANDTLGYYLLDIKGRDVKLECFEFDKRLIIEGGGQIDIGYSNFKDIKGNALAVMGGQGSLHHNRIISAEKSGLAVEQGNYELFYNIIKDNLSYGIYGGMEADLDIYDNYIDNNGGYEVRLMSEMEVYR